MNDDKKLLLSGNEAVAYASLDAGVHLGVGYPGTPSTEILEKFDAIGGRAQWSLNEKVALEVGLGVAYGHGRTIVTMKHVGLNVAADPLFTAAYSGVSGALVLLVADDPGMASSQNEQDSRRYAVAAGVPLLEPADSQQAYDYLAEAIAISERWQTVVLLRLTTRICHSKSIVQRRTLPKAPSEPHYVRSITERVMVPAYARPAHRRMRARQDEIQKWAEAGNLLERYGDSDTLGIIADGISVAHAREAAPDAAILQLGLTVPLPVEAIRTFADGVKRCVVIEEGDPLIADACRAAGINVESKDEMYRFGELNVGRVRRILSHDLSDEPAPPRGKPPQLCNGCPHRVAFQLLSDRGCIVAGDIGCYTLGVLPPFEAMDTCVCMGASIGVGLGLRHALPVDQASKVVSVIGDSTFVHSGLTGIAEMVYNPPATGHVVLILDNGTTAMTGMQEHPGTGRKLSHDQTNKMVFEDVIRAMGVTRLTVLDAFKEQERFAQTLDADLASGELCVIIARKPCILAASRIRAYEEAAKQNSECNPA